MNKRLLLLASSALALGLYSCSSTPPASGGGGGSATGGGAATGGGGAATGGGGAATGGGGAATGGGGAATGGGGAATGGGSATGGGGMTVDAGLPGGAQCAHASDCDSGLCQASYGGLSTCTIPCAQQSDCAGITNSFCDPVGADDAGVYADAGFCMPRSPAHCAECTTDSDCGSLSEVCRTAPLDTFNACRIDCTIAGAAACPVDYSCTPDGARSYCYPQVGDCFDAKGGFCDYSTASQACAKVNTDGSCTGVRSCTSGRLGLCTGPTPQCKGDCTIQDPAGCTENFCASATVGPNNCGMCGNVCPGFMQVSDNVTCDTNQQCTFGCQGENYDVNNNPANGCEATDSPTGNHTSANASNGGSCSICDAMCSLMLSGTLLSDKVVHANPAITGFDTASGSAPDFITVLAQGASFCTDEIIVTFTVTGSSMPNCYKLNAITDKGTYNCQTGGNGTCTMSQASAMSDDTNVVFKVEKTCATTVTESVSYTIAGHF
ncbi:MAG: hypothetical protein QM723_21175 [Myxococcaceae bacterium]